MKKIILTFLIFTLSSCSNGEIDFSGDSLFNGGSKKNDSAKNDNQNFEEAEEDAAVDTDPETNEPTESIPSTYTEKPWTQTNIQGSLTIPPKAVSPNIFGVFSFLEVGVLKAGATPSIVALTYSTSQQTSITALNGATHEVIWQYPFATTLQYRFIYLADIDGDGDKEVLFHDSGKYLYALNHDGTLKWKSAEPAFSVYLLKVFPSESRIYTDLGFINGTNGAFQSTHSSNLVQTMPYDFNGDGSLNVSYDFRTHNGENDRISNLDGVTINCADLITANRSYTPQPHNRNQNSTMGVNFSVGFLRHSDPLATVVYRSSYKFKLHDPCRENKVQVPFNNDDIYNLKGYKLANLDTDYDLELVVIETNFLHLYDTDGSKLWSKSHPVDSGSYGAYNSITLHDFNGDGIQEIVAIFRVNQDTDKVFIYDSKGQILLSYVIGQKNTNSNYVQTPVVVADANGDGKPNLVFGTQNLDRGLIATFGASPELPPITVLNGL